MAEETITILRVDTGKAVSSIRDLQYNIKALKETLGALGIGTQDYQNTLTQLVRNQTALRNAMNGTKASLDDVINAAAGVGQSYNTLVARSAALTKEWRSVDQSTEAGRKRFAELGSQINEVTLQLSNMDATIGRHYRNVGNYANSLGGMNIAMAQIMRELPSLGMNLNTFFLAISNNLPMLFDQIQALRAQNKALIAEGKQGVSVTGAVLKSLVSFNSLMSIGITLLTLYGGKIVEWIGSLFKGKDAVDDMTDALEDMKKAADFEDIGSDIAQFEQLARAYAAIGDNAEAKREFLVKYKDEIEQTGIAITTINEADNVFITNSDTFIEALRKRALAMAGLNSAAEQYAQALAQQTKDEDELQKAEALRAQALARYQELSRQYAGYEQNAIYARQIEAARIAYNDYDAQVKEIQARTQVFVDAGNAYIDAANKLNIEANSMLQGAGITEGGNGGGGDSQNKDATVRAVKLRVRTEIQPELDFDYDAFLEDIQDQIDEAFDPDITSAKNRLTVTLSEIDARRDDARREVNLSDDPESVKQEKLYEIDQTWYKERINAYSTFSDEMMKYGVEGAAAAKDLELEGLDTTKQMEDAKTEYTKQGEQRRAALRKQGALQAISSVSSILDSLADIYEESANGDERLAQQSKNLRIASTIIETISGATAAYMSAIEAYRMLGPQVSIPIGILSAATVMAAGMANVAKIRNTDVSGNSAPSSSTATTSGASVSAPSIPDELPQTRTITSASEETRLNQMAQDQRVYLVYSDIEAAGRKVKIRDAETTF